MFQSCQHVLLGVQHFLCRFPDISMSFFREHSEMFWRANDNLPLIPSNMDGVIKSTLRLERCYGLEGNVRWGVHFCRRGQTKEKSSQPSSVCVCLVNYTHLSLKIWKHGGGRDMKNTLIEPRVIPRSGVIWSTITQSTERIFHIHKQYLSINRWFDKKKCKTFLNCEN